MLGLRETATGPPRRDAPSGVSVAPVKEARARREIARRMPNVLTSLEQFREFG